MRVMAGTYTTDKQVAYKSYMCMFIMVAFEEMTLTPDLFVHVPHWFEHFLVDDTEDLEVENVEADDAHKL